MRNDLIYSRRLDNGFLSMLDVQAKAPAALADGHSDELSSIYGEVDTKNVIEILSDHGYGITQAAQKKPRNTDRTNFVEHLLAFAPREYGFRDVGCDAYRPEIVVYNSRNGLSSLKVFTGVFRMICSNGIIAGEGNMTKVRHTTKRVGEVEDAIRYAADSLPMMEQKVDAFRSVVMDDDMSMDFARKAAALRWEVNESARDVVMSGNVGSFATYNTLDHIAFDTRRLEDRHTDLWTVFNRVQENIIRGGVDVLSISDKSPDGKWRRAQPVRSVSENVRINRSLWDIAEEYLEAA